MKKLLIVYYSWSCGNTERTAKALQSVAGGDLVRLDTAVPYTGSYNDVVDQGQRAFLHGQNFAGKTVVPFMTNGGWPGRVIKDLKAACPGADFACDMQVKFDSNGGDHLETPESKINTWAQSVKALL